VGEGEDRRDVEALRQQSLPLQWEASAPGPPPSAAAPRPPGKRTRKLAADAGDSPFFEGFAEATAEKRSKSSRRTRAPKAEATDVPDPAPAAAAVAEPQLAAGTPSSAAAPALKPKAEVSELDVGQTPAPEPEPTGTAPTEAAEVAVPELGEAPEPAAQPEPAEPHTAAPEAKLAPELAPEPELALKPERAPEPEPAPEPETDLAPEPEPEPAPEPELAAAPLPEQPVAAAPVAEPEQTEAPADNTDGGEPKLRPRLRRKPLIRRAPAPAPEPAVVADGGLPAAAEPVSTPAPELPADADRPGLIPLNLISPPAAEATEPAATEPETTAPAAAEPEPEPIGAAAQAEPTHIELTRVVRRRRRLNVAHTDPDAPPTVSLPEAEEEPEPAAPISKPLLLKPKTTAPVAEVAADAAVASATAEAESSARAPSGETETITVRQTEDRTLGQILAEARELRQLSIEDVAAETKLRQDYVRNIEADNYSRLPAPPYARSLIRKLCILYELQQDEIVDEFERRMATVAKDESLSETGNFNTDTRLAADGSPIAASQGARTLFSIGIAVAVLAVAALSLYYAVINAGDGERVAPDFRSPAISEEAVDDLIEPEWLPLSELPLGTDVEDVTPAAPSTGQ
jgi:transcriptional regulator with XRE-family HTH domain